VRVVAEMYTVARLQLRECRGMVHLLVDPLPVLVLAKTLGLPCVCVFVYICVGPLGREVETEADW
jgi:hypothetical protein